MSQASPEHNPKYSIQAIPADLMDDHIFCPNGCYSSTSVRLKWKLVQMTSPQTRRVVRSGFLRALPFFSSTWASATLFLLSSFFRCTTTLVWSHLIGQPGYLAPGKSETKKPQKSSCKPHPCSCWRRSQLFLVFMLFFVFFQTAHTKFLFSRCQSNLFCDHWIVLLSHM